MNKKQLIVASLILLLNGNESGEFHKVISTENLIPEKTRSAIFLQILAQNGSKI